MGEQYENFDGGEKQSVFVRVLLSLCRICLILGVLFYVLYHLTNGFSAEIETDTAKIYSEDVLLNTSGVIVRDEKVIDNALGGVVSYRYENGTRVNKGAKLATVYGSTSDAATVARASQIDKTVDFLDELAATKNNLSVYDGIIASKEISALLTEVSGDASRGDYRTAFANGDALLKSFIRRDAALGSGADGVAEQLAALKQERAALERSLSGAVTSLIASESGYFYDYADGGEDVFDYENAKSLTVDEYRNGFSAASGAESRAVGKIVLYPKWYFVTEVTEEQCTAFTKGKTYEVRFGLGDTVLNMVLEAENIDGDSAVLVFSSYEMPKDFDFSRCQKVSVVTETVSGYRVPSNALRVVDGVVGVYIRSGNTVKFRVADVIYSSGGYSFISTKTEGKTLYGADSDAENDVYCKGLALYDNVIVGGSKNLTPDRIVN